MSNKKQSVSPINGVPTPRGKPFTSETASEAARKGHEKRAAQKSITKAFIQYCENVFIVDKDGTPLTGAQVIARSIIAGALKGSAEMVKIALALIGEPLNTSIQINNNGCLAELISGLRETTHDLYTETAGANAPMADE